MSELVDAALNVDPIELLGLVSGLVCVWLLIRQNIWTFPIGLVYAFVSVVVFTQQRLYADVLLSVYYVLMNGYGWYYWMYGGKPSGEENLPVSRISPGAGLALLVIVAVATVLMGWFFDTQTDADLAYWDSATTTMSFAAMWMTARKYIENWIVWLIVDVLLTAIYLYKGIEPYALLYFVYLAMAFIGWRTWRQTMVPA
ncbi:MAG: nicotinamide riboside transporter PnuC [Gammaproteobacteria bacterium]|nr:nicotinamide riboside transporter PnuC [Gammaproteobacteria bacterium]